MKFIKQPQQSFCTRQQTIRLMEILNDVHQKGYVHSDIRVQNILLCNDGLNAYLIDFDLAGKEDTEYPSGYQHF